MKISTKLKKRFCTDCNIPIHIFEEPYFTDRLKLYDGLYGTLEKWETFVKELDRYNCEQDYFEEYNRVKDDAINFIKSTAAYKRFNEEDMNQYAVKYDLPGKDIYHTYNDGRTFISIDMCRANFSSLRRYDTSIFDGAHYWETFIGKFTDNEHIKNSKYIRQVILGNCNPKRHITYEKYIMSLILDDLLRWNDTLENKIVFFSNDEIIFDVTNVEDDDRDILYFSIALITSNLKFPPLKVEVFNLHRINGIDGYLKEVITPNCTSYYKPKCVNNCMMPFILRKLNNEKVIDSDKVFYHEGLLAQFVEVPHIEVN